MTDNEIERWASAEALRRGIQSPHQVKGFKEGVKAAHEAMAAAIRRRRLVLSVAHEDDVWDQLARTK